MSGAVEGGAVASNNPVSPVAGGRRLLTGREKVMIGVGIFAACGLVELWGVIHAKKGHLDRVRFIQGNLRGGVATPLAQHETIVEAVAAGDADMAATLLRAHVAGSLQFMERHLRDRPDLFEPDTDGPPDLEPLRPNA